MILLIGYGNDLRQDDRAGLILAERLEHAWCNQGVAVKLLPVHQLTPELAAEIAEPDTSGRRSNLIGKSPEVCYNKQT